MAQLVRTHERVIRSVRSLATVAFSSAALVAVLIACGSDHPPVAAPGTVFNGGAWNGPCATEGAKFACHVETGRHDNIVNCFSGTQTCSEGTWGPCSGSGTLSTLSLPLATSHFDDGLSWKAVTASSPTTDAGGCSANPCNPNCWGIDVDADKLQTLAIVSTSIVGTVKSVEDFPAGAGGPKNSMGNGLYQTSPARIPCTAEPPYPAPTYQHCSSDFCCANYAVGPAAYTCQPWVVVGGENPVAVANCARAPGVDFTVGLACNDSNGHVHVPVCNRGSAAAGSGSLMVAEYAGNPKYSGNSDVCTNPGSPAAYCLINLATIPIASGKCIDLDVNAGNAGSVAGISCPSTFSSGNRTMMINPPATTGYTQLAEGDLCNNYGFHPTTAQGGTCAQYGTQPPPPAGTSYTYTAACPAGTKSVWNQLAYDTSVPNASDVLFRISTAPRLLDGGLGAFTTPVNAAHPATPLIADPAVCPMSGPSPCPKDLYTLLGAAAASNPVLQLDLTLTATTAVPTVNSWQLTYSCIANE